MSILSNAVHATFSAVREISDFPVKKSQVFELYAAYLGFKTYAALRAEITLQATLAAALKERSLSSQRLKERAQQIAMPLEIAILVSNSIATELNKLDTERFDFAKVIHHLGFSVLWGEHSELTESAEVGLYRALLKQADSGDACAKLLQFLWALLAEETADDSYYKGLEGSEYWYKQRLKGVQLSAAQTEWADNFAKMQLRDSNHQKLLSKFPLEQLAAPNVLDVLQSEQNLNVCWRMNAAVVVSVLENALQPERIYQYGYALENLPKNDRLIIDTLSDWRILSAIQDPSYEGLLGLSFGCKNPILAWAWYYFGQRFSIDITADKYWLINSYTGEEWDEYGPAEPVGYDGVKLAVISEEQQNVAKQLAERIYNLGHHSFLNSR